MLRSSALARERAEKKRARLQSCQVKSRQVKSNLVKVLRNPPKRIGNEPQPGYVVIVIATLARPVTCELVVRLAKDPRRYQILCCCWGPLDIYESLYASDIICSDYIRYMLVHLIHVSTSFGDVRGTCYSYTNTVASKRQLTDRRRGSQPWREGESRFS